MHILSKLFIILSLFILNTNLLANPESHYTKYSVGYYSEAKMQADKNKIPFNNKSSVLICDMQTQTLYLINKYGIKSKYTISTSKKGKGTLKGSKKTPTGWHFITDKLGDNTPHYGVLKATKFTGMVIDKETMKKKLNKKDYIVTRIFRLQGLEQGKNKGKNTLGQTVDSFERGIFMHGTTMEYKLGTPCTIGCIHVGLKDLLELYSIVPENTLMYIN